MDTNTNVDEATIPGKLMLLIALLQGFALLLLHQAIDFDFWPAGSRPWLFSLYGMAIAGPLMLLLALRQPVDKAILGGVAAFTLIIGLLGLYIGYQATPADQVHLSPLLVGFIATSCIAVFKALMYIQGIPDQRALDYSHLFKNSWRNFFTLVLSLLFTLIFGLLLFLWAAIFAAIEIDFFVEIFEERWFLYPACALANGLGIVIFRRQTRIIDTATNLLRALITLLLVMLVFVSVLFLPALLFTGLTPLWDSGGSYLILCMQALILFFTNAVYQDDPDSRPYPIWVHRFICLGVFLLPIYSLISFYGLYLRIEQYGWSQMRAWGALAWLILALFSCGYAYAIALKRDHWLGILAWVNVRMGLFVALAMLLVNSPLLDFRKLSVHSQLARLETGEVAPKDFDFAYLRRHLGRPGIEALESLQADYADSHPDISFKIDNLLAFGIGYSAQTDPAALVNSERLRELIRPVGNLDPAEIPLDLLESIASELQRNHWRIQNSEGYFLYRLDLDADGIGDFLLLEQQPYSSTQTLFYREGDNWSSRQLVLYSPTSPTVLTEFIQLLETGEPSLNEKRWRDLEIGEFRLEAR